MINYWTKHHATYHHKEIVPITLNTNIPDIVQAWITAYGACKGMMKTLINMDFMFRSSTERNLDYKFWKKVIIRKQQLVASHDKLKISNKFRSYKTSSYETYLIGE